MGFKISDIKTTFLLILLSFIFVINSLCLADEASNKRMIGAVEKNDAKTVSMLLKSGVNANLIDPFGETILYKACEKGHIVIVKLLLKSGAKNIFIKPAISPTPLHIAAKKGFKKIIKLMVESGVDINSPIYITLGNGGTITPLEYAKDDETRAFIIKLGGEEGFKE